MSLIKEILQIQKPDWLREGEEDANWNIKGLKPVNIIFGKNGSGKSNLLKGIASKREEFVCIAVPEHNKSDYFKVAYKKTSPERGGVYQTDGGISQNITNDRNFVSSSNFENENRQFRQIVSSSFERLLANLALHNPDEVGELVNDAIAHITTLVPTKYYIAKSETNFLIKRKVDNQIVPFNNLSSGEKEMFSLGLDCLTKILWRDEADHVVLLIDEPDVHVHPDLQRNFLDFLYRLTDEYAVQFIIATHSLTFLAGADLTKTAFIFLKDGVTEVKAYTKGEISQQLSLFLSNSLMTQLLLSNKIVLVEGPDDHDIWTQAIRSARGRIEAYFHVCGSKDEIRVYETAANEILRSLTDGNQSIISLRDRDTSTQANLNDAALSTIFRELTTCHEMENLLLSDQVFSKYNKTRTDIFTDNPLTSDIKSQVVELKNQISDSSQETWQKIVGEQIGQAIYIMIERAESIDTYSETHILRMLGSDFVKRLLGIID